MFGILLYVIGKQLQGQADWKRSLHRAAGALTGSGFFKLGVVFLLMVLNWGIEARKWQLALRKVVRISLATSFRAVLSGTTFAFFTPNRMGEYLGRMLHIEEGKRAASVALTIVCSMAQLLVTLAAGLAGLFFIREALESGAHGHTATLLANALTAATGAALLFLTIFYFRLSRLINWLEKLPGVKKWLGYIQAPDGFNATILLRILSLSGIRYLVFIIQYYSLFGVFEVDIGWWQTFWSVSVVFLVIAIVPTVAALTELGVRWETSIEVLQVYSPNTAGILASSLTLWIINLVIPAVIGSLLIFRLRLFRV